MSEFQTKTVRVHASQWRPGVPVDGVKLFYDQHDAQGNGIGEGRYILEGFQGNPMPGDWIADHGNGIYTAHSPEKFFALYDPVITS